MPSVSRMMKAVVAQMVKFILSPSWAVAGTNGASGARKVKMGMRTWTSEGEIFKSNFGQNLIRLLQRLALAGPFTSTYCLARLTRPDFGPIATLCLHTPPLRRWYRWTPMFALSDVPSTTPGQLQLGAVLRMWSCKLPGPLESWAFATQ